MADNKATQIGVRVETSLWKAFREDVEERHGVVRGHLKHEVEAALREYMNASDGGDTHDRLTRIESELESIRDTLEASEEKKKDSGVSPTVENRLQKIRETINSEAEGAPKVHEQVVEMAIRENAGSSDPTMRRYKELLQQDGVVYQDPRPNQSYYFRDAPQFCVAVNGMFEDNELTKREYVDLVDEEYGRDWWGEQVDTYHEQHDSDTGRSFQ
jgi:hypothetical protein